MGDVVIRAEGLSKQYRIGERQKYKALRDTLTDAIYCPFRAARSLFTASDKGTKDERTIWALKDVSFEIRQGEVVGVIGRNGAGKSTLLKILSRITEPTEGFADIQGRVGSLLEVGTGFHPELTGRENIFLNGSIIGMKKREIERKFDEIVAFAEIEKFLDSPVKYYSSGMHMRLAFAVAAHLEPEILLVDEVLAVGDAAFQKKCLGKMGEVAKKGRTILFVSHNMAAVRQLCSIGILLERGEVKYVDSAEKVVRHYLETATEKRGSIDLTSYKFRRGTQEVKIEWAQLRNAEQNNCRVFSIGDDVIIRFGLKSVGNSSTQRVSVAIEILTSDGIQLCNMVNVDSGFQIKRLSQIEVLSARINDIRLYPDTYYVSLWVGSITGTETFDHVENCLSFEVVDGGKLTTRWLPRSTGLLFLTPDWKQETSTEHGVRV